MNSKYLTIVVLALLLIAAACSFVMPERYANYNGGRVDVDLPSNTRTAETDFNIDKESSAVISLPDDSKIFFGKERTPISKADLDGKVRELMADKPEEDQIVYVAASVSDSYGTITDICDQIKQQNVSQVGLIAKRLRPSGPSRFLVWIPDLPNPNEDISKLKPNPLTLLVSIGTGLTLRLNAETMGSVNDPEVLTAKLTEIFKRREENFAIKPGFETRSDLPLSERIEKSVLIKADRSIKYGDIIKAIDAVKAGGAFPIVLHTHDLPTVPIAAYHSR